MANNRRVVSLGLVVAIMYDSKELARNAPGFGVKDDGPMIDMQAMRRYRLQRLQNEIKSADCAAAILLSPINIRYATGSRFAQISSMHFPFRSAVVPPDGGVTMFGWGGSPDWQPETVAETRPMPLFSYFPVGIHSAARVKQWAQEIKDIVKGDRIAVDMVVPDALHALEAEGFEVVPAQPLKEHAAVIKSPEEIACTMHACTVGEVAMC